LPGRKKKLGAKHVLTQTCDEIIDVLISLGFSIQYGPNIESDFYNFEALHIPVGHPARDMQDTFYLSPDMLLRTHTSNVQIRVMETHEPPIRIAAPGRVFRNEEVTARSHVFFHQLEVLYIDKDVTFSDLIATLKLFLSKVFGKEIETRLRPSFFPFVEPGMEVDIRCQSCEGAGCSLCKQSGWLEILGAGMVHPEVLINGGIDPEKYNGYAWGMGIDRLAMLKYGISDIRLFTQNDVRFLRQFASL
jgi:phenylalanyl-tRNA synthetase alpha chain